MCEKCVELDKKIEQYRALARKVTDRPTLDAIDVLIKKNGDEESRAASRGRLTIKRNNDVGPALSATANVTV